MAITASTPLFEIYRGDDVAYLVEVKNEEDQSAVDITGWRFRATMKLDPMGDDDDAPVAVDYGPLTGDEAVAGRFYLLLPSVQTAALLPALYLFDLEREYDDRVTTVIAGRVRVHADVTRRTS